MHSNKGTLHLKFIFSLCLLAYCSFLSAQFHYQFPLINYSPKDYGKEQSPQNWSITQSREGLIYVGNDNGVMEYDGSAWNFIRVVNGQKVFSLAVDSNNTIFAGTIGNFGFLRPGKKGKLEYVSLSDSLLKKEEDKAFTNVWRIYAGTDRVYFQSQEKIIVWDYKTLKVIDPETTFHLASFAHNTLYVRERQKGLMKCVNDKLELIPNSGLFAEYGVFAVLPYGSSKNELLVVTQEKGLFIYNSTDNAFREFGAGNGIEWNSFKLYGGICLDENRYAFNSQLYGTIILNGKGGIVHYINDATGLQDNYVIAQFRDKTGNLWLGLNNGLSRVDLTSPLQLYSQKNGLNGSVYDVCVFQDKVYAATSKGLLVKDPDGNNFTNANGIYNVVWQLKIAGDKLFIATDDKVYSYDSRKLQVVFDGNAHALFISKAGKILVGGNAGLTMLTKDFKIDYVFEEITGEVLGIEEEHTLQQHVYWVTTLGALYKIIDDDSNVYKVTVLNSDNGLPKDWIYPFILEGRLLVGTNYGLYSFSQDKNGASTFDPADFYGIDVSRKSFSFLKDYPDKTYAIIDNKPHLFLKKDRSEVFRPFNPIDMGKENSVFSKGGNAYIALNEGVVIYNEKDRKNYDLPYQTLLRKVITKNDSVLFEGSLTGEYRQDLKLSYRFNELSVYFSSNFYCEEGKTVFAYKLEGSDTAFSAWDKELKARFTNLHEGNYTLIIKSKNVFEKEGEPVTIGFSVLPPWYRTTLAYILYILGFILVIVSAVKVASHRLKQQNKQLEVLVKQRTAEIENKNVELNKQNVQILHQKQEITDSINYAKRIQNAILPPVDEIKGLWKDVFIFFQPKDIVSGDFFWFYKINETEFLIACADCTGHGVPGGFMSMVCTDKLNEAIKHSLYPADILKYVNIYIKRSLRQGNKEGSTKDGMEISLLRVNTESKKVLYAGANRFLWIIKKDSQEIEEIKPTKAGIAGFTEDTQEFIQHELQFVGGDQLYLSSDGYGDQFGGPNGKKLMTKSFREFLVSVKELPIEEQHKRTGENINKWMEGYEQVDDILVIGLRL
ncbi:MAG: PP2C family protein-serine/threonine phosphatase [Bacteroidia bacterium]